MMIDRNELMLQILASWKDCGKSVNTTEELLEWIKQLNENTEVRIHPTSINEDSFWFYDDYKGEILNRKRSFFSIMGVRYFDNECFVSEQPIILQKEIGYLGIIVKVINGVLHFLMQAKIEPGNVNCVQISPTIQATKSNFTRAHGGRLPFYFDYFEKASEKGVVLYDQIQSEQGSRFYGKRNRNIILLVEKDIPVYSNYKWMTLGQIKKLMTIDNLVNMDTRTVLSGIPFVTFLHSQEIVERASGYFTDKALAKSIFETDVADSMEKVMTVLNDYKMFHDVDRIIVPLNQLIDWEVDEYGVNCKKDAAFRVGYYDINIHGREVQHWLQPLFCANGAERFVLFTRINKGIREYLISIRPEVGCFDKVEFGPSLQGRTYKMDTEQMLQETLQRHLDSQIGICKDVVLSEEGGRFYHEQNQNLIVEVDEDELEISDRRFMWVSYALLNYLVQTNNYLNIQLRNLISLIDL